MIQRLIVAWAWQVVRNHIETVWGRGYVLRDPHPKATLAATA
ncbi:hypothetical protein [Roseobacter sp. HKCCD7870]